MDIAEGWQAETMDILTKSPFFLQLQGLAAQDPGINSLLSIVVDGVDYSRDRTKLVVRHMHEYTLHDQQHSFRVLQHMARLMTDEIVQRLQPLELGLLILSAYFHDIGMAPSERQISIYRDLVSKDDLDAHEIQDLASFELYCKSKPEWNEKINRCHCMEMTEQASVLSAYRITEYIRTSHGRKSKEILQNISNNENWAKGLVYKDFRFGPVLAAICESHNENVSDLLDKANIETSLSVAPGEYANSLFICLILRLADLLDFDAKRTPKVLFDHMGIKNPISIGEWEKHRSIYAWTINSSKIAFAGKCSHPGIEKAIRDFCAYIELELFQCRNVLENLHDQYRSDLKERYFISLPVRIEKSQLRPDSDFHGNPIYNYKDLSFSLDQEQVVSLLMGTKLYADKYVAIRELLQNSIDTCNVRKIHEEMWGRHYEPRINIKLYKEVDGNILEFEDNGMGMDEHIVLNYFSKVGRSYYKSEDFYSLMATTGKEYRPISKFGIGIISVFMIADSIQVETRQVIDAFDCSDPVSLRIEGLSGFFWYKKGNKKDPGTSIKLLLKENENTSIDVLKENIKKLIGHINIPVFVNGDLIDKSDEVIDSKWKHIDYPVVSYYDLDFNDPRGLSGSISVALLEKKKKIIDTYEVSKTAVSIQEETYDIGVRLSLGHEKISRQTDSITVDDENQVHVDGHSSDYVSTRGRLYVNGIYVDDNLFQREDEWWTKGASQEKLSWPFPIYYNICVTNEFEINLTASRDRIISDDKWAKFKIELTRSVFAALRNKMDNEKYLSLIKLCEKYDDVKNIIATLMDSGEQDNTTLPF